MYMCESLGIQITYLSDENNNDDVASNARVLFFFLVLRYIRYTRYVLGLDGLKVEKKRNEIVISLACMYLFIYAHDFMSSNSLSFTYIRDAAWTGQCKACMRSSVSNGGYISDRFVFP